MVTAIGQAAWARLSVGATGLTEGDLQALSPMVILAPHPDDETLGCGGLLAAVAARRLRPRVVYLTDGSASHRNAAGWPPSRLASVRRREALTALSVLGVDAAQTLFMDWPDAAPHHPGDEAYTASFARLSAWLDTFGPNSLWAPRAGESHCDHAAACALANDVARRRPGLRQLDYMVWGWADDAVAARRRNERVWRLPCAAFADQRRRALACHRTQTTDLIADAEDAFLIPEDLAAVTERSAEIFIERLPGSAEDQQ